MSVTKEVRLMRDTGRPTKCMENVSYFRLSFTPVSLITEVNCSCDSDA